MGGRLRSERPPTAHPLLSVGVLVYSSSCADFRLVCIAVGLDVAPPTLCSSPQRHSVESPLFLPVTMSGDLPQGKLRTGEPTRGDSAARKGTLWTPHHRRSSVK